MKQGMRAKTTWSQGADPAGAGAHVTEMEYEALLSGPNGSGLGGYRVHWDAEAVRRIEEEIRWARAVNPGGPAEVAGLLLGTVDSSIEIVAFEPVLLMSERDHGYGLNGPGKREFARRIDSFQSDRQPELSVLGFYRSDMGDELELTGHDLGLIRTAFRHTKQVALLIKLAGVQISGAKLFAGTDGQLLSEFQGRGDAWTMPARPELKRSISEESPAHVPVPLEPAWRIDTPEPEKQHPVVLHDRSRSGWFFWLAAAIILCLLATYSTFAILRHRAEASGAAVQPQSAPLHSGLELRAERQGDALRVDWNHSAPVLAAATRGILTVRVGNAEEKQVTLDGNLLRTGAVLYRPVHGDVFLRIVVFGQGSTKLDESTRLIRDRE